MMPGGGGGSVWQTNKLSEERKWRNLCTIECGTQLIIPCLTRVCLLVFVPAKQYMNEEEQRACNNSFLKRKHICRPLSSIVVIISDRIDSIHKQKSLKLLYSIMILNTIYPCLTRQGQQLTTNELYPMYVLTYVHTYYIRLYSATVKNN